MVLTICFADGLRQVLEGVSYLNWDGETLDYEMRTGNPWGVVGKSVPRGRVIKRIEASSKGAVIRGDTENYAIQRNVQNVAFDVEQKMFLGNLAYTGLVENFRIEEL